MADFDDILVGDLTRRQIRELCRSMGMSPQEAEAVVMEEVQSTAPRRPRKSRGAGRQISAKAPATKRRVGARSMHFVPWREACRASVTSRPAKKSSRGCR
jgi:hypothetical protein